MDLRYDRPVCPRSHFTICFCHFQLETRVDFIGRWDFPLVRSCLHISNIMSLNLRFMLLLQWNHNLLTGILNRTPSVAGKRPVASYNQCSKNALTEALLNFSLVGLSWFWLFLILWMECVATAMKATITALSCATIYCALQGGRSEISCCDLFSQKATEQYFTVVPFIMLKVVVLNLTVSIQTKASSYGYSIAL